MTAHDNEPKAIKNQRKPRKSMLFIEKYRKNKGIPKKTKPKLAKNKENQRKSMLFTEKYRKHKENQ